MSRPRHSPAELEYWGEVFISGGGQHGFGLTFEQFLLAPSRYLARKTLVDAAAIEAQCGSAGLPRRDGAPFERLRHHRFPRSVSKFVAREDRP